MKRCLIVIICLALPPAVHATRQPVHARHGMVVAMESIGADAGVSVLQKGGNAVDAAVALGFALAVTHPFAGNIGGGGYMLIRLADGRATFIDRSEEHTSELQSRPHILCRLLLDEKNLQAQQRSLENSSKRPVTHVIKQNLL